MKIAVASAGYNINSPASTIFGRSSSFIVANLENGEIKGIYTIENPFKSGTGSGSTSAQLIADQKVEALITGKLGPVAFQILKNAGIKIYKIIPGNVEKNLKRFAECKLEEITSLSGGFPQ